MCGAMCAHTPCPHLQMNLTMQRHDYYTVKFLSVLCILDFRKGGAKNPSTLGINVMLMHDTYTHVSYRLIYRQC